MDRAQKTVVIENWFATDYVLFGKRAKEALKDGELKDYLANKGPLFSNLIDTYNSVGYTTGKTYKSMQELRVSAMQKANNSLWKAKEIIKSSSVASMVKEEIKESGVAEGLDEKEIAKYVVLKKFKEIALDSLLFEGLEVDSDVKKKLNDWHGKVFVNAHKILRNDTINASL